MMYCYFCNAEIKEFEDRVAVDEENQVVCMCSPCYELAKKFFPVEPKIKQDRVIEISTNKRDYAIDLSKISSIMYDVGGIINIVIKLNTLEEIIINVDNGKLKNTYNTILSAWKRYLNEPR